MTTHITLTTPTDPFAIAGAIASIATALIALIGLYSLILAGRSLRSTVYFQVLEMMEQTRDERHILEELIPANAAINDFNKLTEPQIKQLDRLARNYDKLGLLVKHHTVPLSFVLDFYSRPLVVGWHRMAPYINTVRATRNQANHMAKFEELAIKAKQYRDKYHPGEESFSLHTERDKKWHVWRR